MRRVLWVGGGSGEWADLNPLPEAAMGWLSARATFCSRIKVLGFLVLSSKPLRPPLSKQ